MVQRKQKFNPNGGIEYTTQSKVTLELGPNG